MERGGRGGEGKILTDEVRAALVEGGGGVDEEGGSWEMHSEIVSDLFRAWVVAICVRCPSGGAVPRRWRDPADWEGEDPTAELPPQPQTAPPSPAGRAPPPPIS